MTLICTICGKRLSRKTARLIEGKVMYCRADNLKRCCKLENESHKLRHGTRLRGEACAQSKLTEARVLNIRARARYGNYTALAREFGVSTSTIRKVVAGTRWRHVTGTAANARKGEMK